MKVSIRGHGLILRVPVGVKVQRTVSQIIHDKKDRSRIKIIIIFIIRLTLLTVEWQIDC